MGKIHLAAPDPYRSLRKPHHVMAHHIGENRWHGDGQTRAAGAVIQRRQLMLNVVAVPVLLRPPPHELLCAIIPAHMMFARTS